MKPNNNNPQTHSHSLTPKPQHQYKTLFGSLIFLSCTLQPSSATVYLKAKSFSLLFPDAPARFAVRVNASGICGGLEIGEPLDACSGLKNVNGYRRRAGEVRIVLVERGKCAFEDKVRNAQDSGFDAVIVYDDHEKRNLVSMIGNSEGIWAHAVFITKTAGEALKLLAQGEEGECCINPSLEETAWTVLVISLISLFAIISILAAFFFTRNRRLYQQGLHHYSTIDSGLVKLLPCLTFSSTLLISHRTGETCAICLEDYKSGDSLRVLPCRHDFHAICVDSWLTKWATFCPVCKHDLITETADSLISERSMLLSSMTVR